MDEEVLVFQCVISNLPPEPTSSTSSTTPQAPRQNATATQQSPSQTPPPPPPLPPLLPTRALPASPPPALPPIAPPANLAPGQPPSTQSMRVSVQTPAAAQQAIQQTLNQLTANPPIRPNIQVIPIQYQAILIKSPLRLALHVSELILVVVSRFWHN